MFEYVKKAVQDAEDAIGTQAPTLEEVLPRLRSNLGLDDFGSLLLNMPDARFPKLSHALPRMASDEVQRNWTGNSGLPLLRQSANFVRAAAFNYTKLTARPLAGARVLDYGCGYGRLARLMYYFTDPSRLYGLDPWDRSIEICHESGLRENFAVCDYLPTSLPLLREKVDFIYAFSVFTHLSLRATRAALDVCRQYISEDGVMLITIRPVEYWSLDKSFIGLDDASHLRAQHLREGFAFTPHNIPPVDGDVTYGDTSMTTAWIEASFPRWTVAGTDRSFDDAYQIYVFLRPR